MKEVKNKNKIILGKNIIESVERYKRKENNGSGRRRRVSSVIVEMFRSVVQFGWKTLRPSKQHLSWITQGTGASISSLKVLIDSIIAQ